MSDKARTQADLLRTFRDVTDDGYHVPLEQGEGWDVVAGGAQILARSSEAVETNSQAFFILPSSRQVGESASGARRASCTLRISRAKGSAARAVTIPAGKALLVSRRDSRGNPAVQEAYRLAEPVTLPAGDLGPYEVRAEAVRPGNQANAAIADQVAFAPEGARVVAIMGFADHELVDTAQPDTFTAGDVGRYLRIQGEGQDRLITAYSQDDLGRGHVMVDGDPVAAAARAFLLEWSELGILLEQATPFAGGRHATLDQVGLERDMPRGPGETDLDYAYRISSLPDVVSPAALERIVARILSPLEIGYQVFETRDPGLRGFVLDQSPLDLGAPCSDDPWSGSVLLTDSATKRFFLVCVEPNPNLGWSGLFFDVQNAGVNFYDSAELGGTGGALAYENAIATLWANLNIARGGGVGFRIVEHQTPEPITREYVELTVSMHSSSSPYITVRDRALATFFQLLAPGQATTEPAIAEAISGALLQAGLDPYAFVTTNDSLTPSGPRAKLETYLA